MPGSRQMLERREDLLSMTLEAFCAKHGCSVGAASQRRAALSGGQGFKALI